MELIAARPIETVGSSQNFGISRGWGYGDKPAPGRCVRRDVAADLEALAVGRGHHHRGVPADQPPDLTLHLLVAGEPRLTLGRDGVDEVGAAQRRDADLLLTSTLQEPQHDVAGALTAVRV